MSALATDSPPEGFLETYRAEVPAWECDGVEHFTVPYYFDKFERTTARFLAEIGVDRGVAMESLHRDFYVRYMRELRVASVYVIQTGIIGRTGTTLHLGHRVIDPVDGTVCTSMEHGLEVPSTAAMTEPGRVDWTGPARERREVPPGDHGWLRTGTDIIMPKDTDPLGRMRLSECIHRFSSSGSQLMARFGWTSRYEEEFRIGFSTFEMQLELERLPQVGTLIDSRARLAHVGRSSVHIVHQILDAGTGETLATMHQLGVHLDKNVRRPSAIADHIRESARASMDGV